MAAGDWRRALERLKQNRQRLVAAIGLWEPHDSVPLFLSPADVLRDEERERLQRFVQMWEQRFMLYKKMKSSLSSKLGVDLVDRVLEPFLDWLEDIEAQEEKMVTEDTFVGATMHFCCLVERLERGIQHGSESIGNIAASPETPFGKKVLQQLSLLEQAINVTLPRYEKSVFVAMFDEQASSV